MSRDAAPDTSPAPAPVSRPSPAAAPTGRRSHWIRRVGLPGLGRLNATLGMLAVVAWLAGRVLSDRWGWSQPLSWLPTHMICLGAWACFLLSWACESLSTRTAGAKLRPLLLIGVVGLTGWMLAIEWRSYRVLTRPLASLTSNQVDITDGSPSRIDVVYWNLGSARDQSAAERALALDADLTIIANPRPAVGTRAVREAFDAALAADRAEPDEDATNGEAAARAPQPKAADPRTIHIGPAVVLSRHPIRRAAYARFVGKHVGGRRERRSRHMLGVCFIELDFESPATGGPTVVWIVDLPSDPVLPRDTMMHDAARTTEEWEGRERVYDPEARRWATRQADERGFPAPDLIIGDFNTPRDARSLQHLVGEHRESHAAAGLGPDLTWPSLLPIIAIDLAFVDTAWDVTRSEAIDLGVGLHHAIRVTIEP